MEKIKLYDKKIINKDQIILLVLIEEKKKINDVIKYQNLINDFKKNLEDLERKEIIIIESKTQIIKINHISQDDKKETSNTNKELTVKELDSLRVILNREIKNYELTILQKWILKYTFEEIKEAVYLSGLKNIDNFNYVEKILVSNNLVKDKNNIETNNIQASKVERKFDFFE